MDYSWLGNHGVGRVANEVLRRCPENWKIIPIRKYKNNAAVLAPLSLSRNITCSHSNLFWSPGFIPPAFPVQFPVVVTIHDLTQLYYYKIYHKIYYDYIIKRLLKNVNYIITVSAYTKNEIVKWSGISEKKIIGIHNGVGKEFNLAVAPFSLGKPYILYAGNRRNYKNVLGLIRAFAHSKLFTLGYMLALTGNPDKDCLRVSTEEGVVEHVHYLGFVEENDLPSVYRGAHAVAFVSYYEGFGLPILEAMASGVPVITSNTSAMPEVAGDAALIVNPHDIDAISSGLEKITTDHKLRSELISRGLSRAGMFSWDKTAEKYWNVFEELL